MNTFIGRAIFLLSIAVLLASCDEDPVEPGPIQSHYASPTAPESLITNLQLSYRQREINEYVKLLAPEFIFKFQPLDANDIGTQFWTRAQDSTGTRALLTTTLVSDIHLNLIGGGWDLSIDSSDPVDSVRVPIITTELQIDQTDGITWFVTDQQDFFFRQGKAENGENPAHWLIYEWDDLPTLGAPGISTNRTTWGKVKSQYRN